MIFHSLFNSIAATLFGLDPDVDVPVLVLANKSDILVSFVLLDAFFDHLFSICLSFPFEFAFVCVIGRCDIDNCAQ